MAPGRLTPWVPLAPAAWLRPRLERLPFPLEEPTHQIYAFGRQGLWHGIEAIGLERGDRVLAPAWHHGSEIEVLLRRGCDVDLYDGIWPDEAELDRLLTPQTRALQLVHPLGFPQDAPRWRRWCDERELLLIEDAAQAWLADVDGRPVGSFGDLAVFCLYKTIGIPEGAAVVARSPVRPPDENRTVGVGDHARRHASWAAQRLRPMAWLARRRPSAPYDPQADIALGEPDGGPWVTTEHLLRRLAEPGVAGRRRANYRVLLDGLGHRVAEPFRDLPAGASPFVFPITSASASSGEKATEVQALADAGVKALDVWSIPHPITPSGAFPEAEALRSSLIGLPVHQELRRSDLARIIDVAGGRPSSAPALSLTVSDPEDAAVLDAWRRLALASRNVFATPELLLAWRSHVEVSTQLLVGRAGDGSIQAVIPLARQQVGPLSALRFWGFGVGDQLGPVHQPGQEALVGEALRRHLAGDGAVLVGEHLPAEAGWAALLEATAVRHERSPSLRVRGRSWEDWLSSRSSNFRQEVRRRERNLHRSGAEVRLRLAETRTLEDDLDTLFCLHAARWGGATGFGGDLAPVHRDIARVAMTQGWLRLWILELDGLPAAAWYGFRYAGIESYYQAGRDPRFDHLRVGFVLLAHTVRSAIGDGVTAYRFLRGDERYKDRFADDEGSLETIVAAPGGTVTGAVALRGAIAAARGVRSLPVPIRAFARRVGGR